MRPVQPVPAELVARLEAFDSRCRTVIDRDNHYGSGPVRPGVPMTWCVRIRPRDGKHWDEVMGAGAGPSGLVDAVEVAVVAGEAQGWHRPAS